MDNEMDNESIAIANLHYLQGVLRQYMQTERISTKGQERERLGEKLRYLSLADLTVPVQELLAAFNAR